MSLGKAALARLMAFTLAHLMTVLSIVVLQAFTLKIYICESAMAYSLAKSMRPAHWVQHYCEIEYEGHTHH